MSELLSEALAHRLRGHAVLPVTADKRPASRAIHRTRGTYSWKVLGDELAEEDELHDWCKQPDVAGVGVICGEPSRLAVVDVDDEAIAPELPESATVTTRRGRHVYYRSEEPVRTRAYDWGEVRGDGAYVVAPATPGYSWEITPEELELANFSRAQPYRDPISTTCFLVNRTVPREPRLAHLPHRGSEDAAATLANLERDEHAAFRMAGALGAPEALRLGESFRCLLHPDRHPSATLWRSEPGAHVLYRDWDDGTWFPLATVRARLAGRTGPLAGPELSIWKRRLAHEAGLLEPFPLIVDADAPPESITATWKGFLGLVALRWAIEPGPPAPFSVRFAAAWCGISAREAHEAITELARRGFLGLEGRDSHGTRLWLPQGVRPPT